MARQKRRVHQELVRRWSRGVRVDRVLKTDLFEEAHGDDQILSDLFPEAPLVMGFDVALATVRRAARRITAGLFTSDVRHLSLASGSVDLIISNSTLDHFHDAESFEMAIGELARVLRPGGVLVVTVDNPYNPLYPLLRWLSRRGRVPFFLGYTPSAAELAGCLRRVGLDITDTGTVLHNPRMVSTVIFLAIRRVFGRHGDLLVRFLLWGFELMERLPTRGITACFLAARARKPEEPAAGDLAS